MPRRACEAVFDFAGTDGQLSFTAGDVITITTEGGGHFWTENGQ